MTDLELEQRIETLVSSHTVDNPDMLMLEILLIVHQYNRDEIFRLHKLSEVEL